MDSDNARRNFDLLKQELKEICEKRKIPFPDIVVIDIPEDEEVSTHVETFRKMIDCFEDNDELFGCLTFGTKPLSEVVRMSIQYAYRVKKNASISCIVYGSVDRSRSGDPAAWTAAVYDETALVQLDEIVRLLAARGVENPRESIRRILDL